MNKLYFGDNLDVLRKFVASESVDLVYLDPPFNSQTHYNVLFVTPDEQKASAQAGAFRDTWVWGEEAEASFAEMMRIGGPSAKLLDALRSAMGETDMMAYIAMMAARLVELHRVLKPHGSLYLHCDSTASHYLKIILDSIFGRSNFRNEIIWKRSHAHSDAKQGARHFGRVTDTLLYFSKSDRGIWNTQYTPYDEHYVNRDYRRVDAHGRKYRIDNLQGPGGEAKGNPYYEIMGVSRYWRYSREKMNSLIDQGRIIQTRPGAVPQFKRYLDEMPGVPLQNLWSDLPLLNNRSKEALGYPTQKPLALLERIIKASSNEGDTILDPFCGCGTTIEAAESLGRRWIGIDVAIHAIKVIEARISKLKGVADYCVEGIPRDFASAERLAMYDKYQFQWWANYLFNPHALREQKKGADRGIDGELFFPNGPGKPWGKMLTSVKGGENVGPAMVRDFARVLERERANLGLFICLRRPTQAMVREAVSCGFADTVHSAIPKMQIVAIEDWFGGKIPKLPPLEHLPSASFASRAVTRKKLDLLQPELPLSFVGGKKDHAVIRHFNPGVVSGIVA